MCILLPFTPFLARSRAWNNRRDRLIIRLRHHTLVTPPHPSHAVIHVIVTLVWRVSRIVTLALPDYLSGSLYPATRCFNPLDRIPT